MNHEHVVVRVWDLPTRFFHWAMVCLMAALWWSADAGEMEYHQLFAYGLMILLVFRICWGFVGSESARFSHFVRGPKTALAYLKQLKQSGVTSHLGHNPLGAYMVICLMLLLSVQLVTGLFATDDIFTEGPFYSYVSTEVAGSLTWLHKQNFNAILALTAIHIMAVVVHSLHGDKLIPAMVHGCKRVPQHLDVKLDFKPVTSAILILLCVAGVVLGMFMWPVLQVL